MQEPTTYLQPLEINLLYQFNGEYSLLQPHILYCPKKKIPNIFEPHVPIPSDSICALLSQNRIIPYEICVIPNCHQKLLILRDDKSDQFLVTFEKSKSQFINIAKVSGVSELEFSDYVECIWEAYNLQGWKKHYWKLKSFITMIYVKYIFYVGRIISCLGSRIFVPFETAMNYVCKASNYQNMCVELFAFVFFLLLCIPYVCMIGVMGYTLLFVWYYATLLPFFILALPLKHFLFGFNFYSFLFVSQGLASLYVCCFPQIKNCLPFSFGKRENIEPEYILPRLLKRFEIKPIKIMSVVSSLVQKRKNCLIECLDTLIFCFLIFAFGFGMSSALVLSGGSYF